MAPLNTSSMQPPVGQPHTTLPCIKKRAFHGHIQQQSYLKEYENGRALKGGSRRRRNAVLGKGGHAGTPMTTPSPHTPGRARHAPCLHSPQAPTL